LGELLDLGLKLLLAPGARALGVLTSRQRLVGTLEELLLPLRDRGLGHLQAPRRLHLRHPTAQDRQDHLELLVGRLERLPAHGVSPFSGTSSHHTSRCPRNLDSPQTNFTYEPYGRSTASVGSYATYPHQFTGRDQNINTGLQYNRARYYAYGHGRFISEDPIGFLGGSVNPYLYGLAAPQTFKDPAGLSARDGVNCGLASFHCLDARERLILLLDLTVLALGIVALATGGAPLWVWLALGANVVSWVIANASGGALQGDITHQDVVSTADSAFNGFGGNFLQVFERRAGLQFGVIGDLIQVGVDYTIFTSS